MCYSGNNKAVKPLSQPCVPLTCAAQVTVTFKIGEGAFGEVSRAEVFPYGTVAIKWLKVGNQPCWRLTLASLSIQADASALAHLFQSTHPKP